MSPNVFVSECKPVALLENVEIFDSPKKEPTKFVALNGAVLKSANLFKQFCMFGVSWRVYVFIKICGIGNSWPYTFPLMLKVDDTGNFIRWSFSGVLNSISYPWSYFSIGTQSVKDWNHNRKIGSAVFFRKFFKRVRAD